MSHNNLYHQQEKANWSKEGMSLQMCSEHQDLQSRMISLLMEVEAIYQEGGVLQLIKGLISLTHKLKNLLVLEVQHKRNQWETLANWLQEYQLVDKRNPANN